MTRSRRSRSANTLRPGCGVVTTALVVALAGLASCTRPLGIWEEQPSAPPGPCGEPSGLDPDAAWPMDGRCPGRTAYLPVHGPVAPEVLWTVEAGDSYSGEAVVDADEVVYARMMDPDGRSSLHAIAPDGAVRWKTPLHDQGTAAETEHLPAFPALGRDGVIYLATERDLVAVDRSGAERFRFDYARLILQGWQREASAPVVLTDGTVALGSGQGFVAVDPVGARLWDAWAYDSGPVFLDPSGQILAVQFRSWELGYDLGHPTSEVARYGPSGARETIGLVEDRVAAMMTDPDGTLVLLTQESKSSDRFRLVKRSPEGELDWALDLGGPFTDCAVARDDARRIRTVCGYWTAEHGLRVTRVDPDGSVAWSTEVPEAHLGEPRTLVDLAGTTYLAGTLPDRTSRVWAIDAGGEIAWELEVPGRNATIVAMGWRGRLYVKTRTALVAVGDP